MKAKVLLVCIGLFPSNCEHFCLQLVLDDSISNDVSSTYSIK